MLLRHIDAKHAILQEYLHRSASKRLDEPENCVALLGRRHNHAILDKHSISNNQNLSRLLTKIYLLGSSTSNFHSPSTVSIRPSTFYIAFRSSSIRLGLLMGWGDRLLRKRAA